ncbi:protein SMG9 [Drosophila tropicalis]|uniref:protein SMG9 n=1 Tax=Drosophila tropicalis TaxID=46794 RepID=UPI0035ABD6A0
MAENHRRRFRNKKRDDARQQHQQEMLGAPVTIARRDDPRVGLVQPRILLKKDQYQQQQQQQQQLEREAKANNSASSNIGNQDTHSSFKTIIINRSQDARNSSERCPATTTPSNSSVCAALVSSSSGSSATSTGKDKSNANGQDTATPLRMIRPTPLTLANGVFNANARKLFYKTNTDFTVIGILGAQGVGKSSLLNLLSSDYGMDYDYHQRLFSSDADNCTFLTRHKSKSIHKNILRPRTENLQFFITKERFILLDTPPLMSAGASNQSGLKETDYHDLQSLATICHLLNVCHILIIAVDEVNLEQFHLINAALRLRPQSLGKGLVKDYLPHVLFVRTRAQRHHFEQTTRERLDQQLIQLYSRTGLHIYRGRGEARCLNSLVMPEINGNGATVFHPNLGEVVRQFRERVLGTTRSSAMCQGNDFTETMWFEMLAESFRKGTQHFEKIYVDIKGRHLDAWKQRRNDSWRNFQCGDC